MNNLEKLVLKDILEKIKAEGVGKLKHLISMDLEKVKKGISVDNLLILTFTKMAAKEMRERIGEKLKENGFIL